MYHYIVQLPILSVPGIPHANFISIVGVGKDRPTLIGPEKATPITGTTLRTTSTVPADSRQ